MPAGRSETRCEVVQRLSLTVACLMRIRGRLKPWWRSARKSGHELRCYDDALAFIAQTPRCGGTSAHHCRGPTRRAHDSAALKKLLKAELYPYQAEGALFAARAGRCLIGDEMGLGKTIQAIAAAEIMARHFGVERVLVVCPTSLKHQWQREIERFTDRQAQVIGGLRAARERSMRTDGLLQDHQLRHAVHATST